MQVTIIDNAKALFGSTELYYPCCSQFTCKFSYFFNSFIFIKKSSKDSSSQLLDKSCKAEPNSRWSKLGEDSVDGEVTQCMDLPSKPCILNPF